MLRHSNFLLCFDQDQQTISSAKRSRSRLQVELPGENTTPLNLHRCTQESPDWALERRGAYLRARILRHEYFDRRGPDGETGEYHLRNPHSLQRSNLNGIDISLEQIGVISRRAISAKESPSTFKNLLAGKYHLVRALSFACNINENIRYAKTPTLL